MKVLMISGDKNILTPGSEAHARLQLQKAQVDTLDVFVWPQTHSLWEMYQATTQTKYDVITAQDPFWRGHIAMHLAQLTGAKLNIQVHTDLSAQPWWRRVWARVQLRRADSVRVVSEEIQKQVERYTRAPISVLPIYVNLAPFRQLVHRPHSRFKKVILWVGRFEPEKDPLAALSIIAEVRESGIDAGLILLGAGGLEKVMRVRAKSLAPFVEFPGWHNPVPYLEVADVVVSTSRHESYGASMLEALAAGVPVVAPDIGIAKQAGAIVVSRSELAAAVIRVLHSGQQGELLIAIPSAEEWAKRWKETLL